MPEIKNLENLLQQTRIILHHQNEKEKLKGEKFNIFSILKMEMVFSKIFPVQSMWAAIIAGW